ncbi:hypothetical protein COV28_01660 [candidate division WWE3 bacterium CG10_big_fil_rev_8_21_14_0_10_48_23]|uniref:Major facilitator superfamily (MFS) profile domain-containing protein n=1 Tax=candidate division WWE3 bacterium CG_4_9_14_0_2_um_filter_48_10 TaxID=1975078 RepID=A0A2M8EIX5_UNCKA|nr:MAG: hypothetical protein CO059_02075 [candidate division WWE3 bacterium CG_4_9_14_0_2_um_filter_48_10]PJE51837.1 MAG: hypothetical protein COV28_01660 [candidate division WWE3 bacterium CG10_big_fil_rev_8_21_14_0_10_48_23]
MRQFLKQLIGVRINPVIRVLVASDILIFSAFGLLGPVFAIFLLENIQGGSAKVAGFAAMVWLLTRAIFAIPISVLIDHWSGERDDFWFVFWGSLGISFVPIAYLFASLPIHVYLIQAFYGFCHAAVFPSWFAIFTRHIDRHKEGEEWATYITATDLGAAAAAAAGGVIAVTLGFKVLFILASLFSFLGAFLLLWIRLRCKIGWRIKCERR